MSIFKHSASHVHLLNTRLVTPNFKHSASHVHLLNTRLVSPNFKQSASHAHPSKHSASNTYL
jgi:hypothetical protein